MVEYVMRTITREALATKVLTQETASSLADHPHASNPWNRCSIDFKGRLGCECDLKGDGCSGNIVPNVVHYVMSQMSEITIDHLISIMSVLRNQRPDKIVIHCTCSQIKGHLWNKWLANETRIEVRTIPRLLHVFHQNISGIRAPNDHNRVQYYEPWLAGDALRLYVLLSSPEGGGIFLDNDVYVVSSLEKYFKYEFSLTWFERYVGTQIIIAHRDARILRFWLDTLDNPKFLKKWNFLARNFESLLKANPALDSLVHWVKRCHDKNVTDVLFNKNTSEWRQFEVIHVAHRTPEAAKFFKLAADHLDEASLRSFNCSFGEMVREVLYG